MRQYKPEFLGKVMPVDNKEKMSKHEKLDLIERLTKEMNSAARNLEFERAMELRDIIFELESE